jgi:hypothetical protein
MKCWQFFATILHILSKEQGIKFREWIPDRKRQPTLKIIPFLQSKPAGWDFLSPFEVVNL